MRPNRLLPMIAVLGMLGASTGIAGTLQDVLSRGNLRVGVTLAEPWALRNDSGDLEGFEVDVARKLAADMGVDVTLLRYDNGAIIRALEAGEIDLIAAGLTVTPERALHVNFSNPYATGGIGIASNIETTAEVGTLEELNAPEYTVATVADSVAENLAQRILPRATQRSFRSEIDASEALVNGEVDVYLEQEPVPNYLAIEYRRQVDARSEPLLPAPSAFAVTKGDPDFLAFLNAWIVAREADTWLPTLHRHWFRTLEWRD
ncbi:MAG: transporter substrate-binding domain-containing protein [Gammaproteobacteria bacterium]